MDPSRRDVRDKIVGDASDEIEYGAGQIVLDTVPLVSAVEAFVAADRFIQSDAPLILAPRLVLLPRRGIRFGLLGNKNSSFLDKDVFRPLLL